jgi:hypothetical protein
LTPPRAGTILSPLGEDITMSNKGKIIAGAVVVALVVLYIVSPGFQKVVRYGWDTVQNFRYTQSRSSRTAQTTDAQRYELARQCRNRMTAIQQAKVALLQQSGYVQAGSRVTINDIAQRLGERPENLVCPETGEAYLLGGIADPVACTVGGHGTPTDQQDDHEINP